ncbi:unnamed protein product [Urochloa humidicola]
MKYLRKIKIWCESTEDVADDLNNDLVKAIRQYTRTPMGAGCDRSMKIDFQGLPPGSLRALRDLYNRRMSLQETYYLSSLKLKGDLSTSHEFVATISGLTELCLSSTTVKRDLLLSLSAMPYLLYLTLISDEIEDFVIKVGTFQCLRRLRFVLQNDDPVLPEIEEGALPELISLQIPCKNLVGLSGIEIRHLRKLQEIELHPEVSKPARQKWEAAAWNHPNRPNIFPFISVDDLVGEEPTNNPVVSSKETRHEEAVIQGQLVDQSSGPSVPQLPVSTCYDSSLGNEMENPTGIQGRTAEDALKSSASQTGQKGNYTSTHVGSSYNSAKLLSASNCTLQSHGNGPVNEDLRIGCFCMHKTANSKKVHLRSSGQGRTVKMMSRCCTI